jgi:hypothetical protein
VTLDDENSISAKHREDDGDEAYEARQRAKDKAIMDKACFCPRCGGDPAFEINSCGVTISCSDCYDGAPDAGPQMSVSAETLALAVDRWNEMVDEQDDADPDPEFEADPLACPGCGGNCQTACR